ncbi:MAG: hypothetical protein DWQ19_11105 [Crenarchaeota archaeon]|nr:MAG: hypothetical protein DWQ19_11105 [Thermoproteota archaeon]
MLETPDKKKFFTPKRNYSKLLEFANSFNCEISTVKLQDGEILDLTSLAEAVTTEQSCKRAKFELIERKKPRKRNRN